MGDCKTNHRDQHLVEMQSRGLIHSHVVDWHFNDIDFTAVSLLPTVNETNMDLSMFPSVFDPSVQMERTASYYVSRYVRNRTVVDWCNFWCVWYTCTRVHRPFTSTVQERGREFRKEGKGCIHVHVILFVLQYMYRYMYVCMYGYFVLCHVLLDWAPSKSYPTTVVRVRSIMPNIFEWNSMQGDSMRCILTEL